MPPHVIKRALFVKFDFWWKTTNWLLTILAQTTSVFVVKEAISNRSHSPSKYNDFSTSKHPNLLIRIEIDETEQQGTQSAVAKRTLFFTTLKPWPISIICRFNEFAIFPPRAKKIAVVVHLPHKNHISRQERYGHQCQFCFTF